MQALWHSPRPTLSALALSGPGTALFRRRWARQQARLAIRLAVMAAILVAVYALDRTMLDGPTTWLAYAIPVLLAPRLVPLGVAPLVLVGAVLLGWNDALGSGDGGRDQAVRVLMLVAIALYAMRDVRREHELEAAKARLLQLVSHELRTPLHHIKGFASTLLQTDLEWDAATQRECLVTIEQSADRLTRLIDTLLDMARVADGCLAPQRERCAPAALVGRAVEMAHDSIALHSVEVDLPPSLPDVLVDPAQVERVLVNLLDNAAKYSAPGLRIQVSARAERRAVVVRVADEGAGVAPSERRRIFARFQRGTAATRAHAPGTGLGLALAREILAAQDGAIWVEPNVERGSVFAVRLARADVSARPTPRERPPLRPAAPDPAAEVQRA
ncbi:MAG TPA: ATP-binding protein [Chloroflexota bacterium]|nr:ATP-binding protein [Chloroflexota bacterium]